MKKKMNRCSTPPTASVNLTSLTWNGHSILWRNYEFSVFPIRFDRRFELYNAKSSFIVMRNYFASQSLISSISSIYMLIK